MTGQATGVFSLRGLLPSNTELASIGRRLPNYANRVQVFTYNESGELTIGGYRSLRSDTNITPGTLRITAFGPSPDKAMEYVRAKLGGGERVENAEPVEAAPVVPVEEAAGATSANFSYPNVPDSLAVDIEPPLNFQETRRRLYFAQRMQAQGNPPSFEPPIALSIIVHLRMKPDGFVTYEELLRDRWNTLVDAALKADTAKQSQINPIAVTRGRDPALDGDYRPMGNSWPGEEIRQFLMDRCTPVNGLSVITRDPAGAIFTSFIDDAFRSKSLGGLVSYLELGFAFAHSKSSGNMRALFDACVRKKIWAGDCGNPAFPRMIGDFQRLAEEEPCYSVLDMLLDLELARHVVMTRFENDRHYRLLVRAENTLRRVVRDKLETAIWYTPLLQCCVDRLDAQR